MGKNKVVNVRFKAMVNPDFHNPQAVNNNGLVEGYYYYNKVDDQHYIIDSFSADTYWKILPETLTIQNIDPYMVVNRDNINFSLIGPDDDRWEDFYEQRMKQGFDESETWSLDSTIAKFILPRLKVLKDVKAGYPAHLTMENWDNILQKMIDAFAIYSNDCCRPNDEEEDKINEGLDLFREYFRHLWW